MRKRFAPQIDLGQTPIEKVIIPLKSRDELPPILTGLQWIFRTPGLHEAVFELLERTLQGTNPTRTGRPGMDLWHVLVLGVVRVGLDCNYDRMEHIANFDGLVREIMGLPSFGTKITFHHRTISDNICLIEPMRPSRRDRTPCRRLRVRPLPHLHRPPTPATAT